MKIAVMQASTQAEKNGLLYSETKRAVAGKGWQVANLGVFPGEPELSYIQMALAVGLVLNTGAADFVVTGCSSGNGMAIACNALPGVICGYLPTPGDAYLFGRINGGNCASLPLGLNFGWAGELNLRFTLEKLFEEPMNTGYPPEAAQRKRRDTETLKSIKGLAQTSMPAVLGALEEALVRPIYDRADLMGYIRENGRDAALLAFLAQRA